MTDEPDPRPRGFLTKADREFLTTPEDELDVEQQTIRKRKGRIRERVYNALLDFELLLNMDQRERDRIFKEVRDNWSDDYFAIKSIFQFLYLGLQEQGLHEAVPAMFEDAVLAAVIQYGDDHDQHAFSPDVDCSIDVEYQTPEELEAAEYQAEESVLGEMYADVDNDLGGRSDVADNVRRHYQVAALFDVIEVEDRSPNKQKEEETVELLRDFIESREIESYGEFVEYTKTAAKNDDIRAILNTLKTVVTPLNVDKTEIDSLDELEQIRSSRIDEIPDKVDDELINESIRQYLALEREGGE